MLLGIDIGITNTGVAVYCCEQQRFVYQSTIVASHSEIADKLVYIEKELSALIDRYTISRCCYEHPVMRSGKNVQNINCALGVVFLVLRKANIPFKGLTATTVKKEVTGNSKASKQEIIDELHRRNLGIPKFDSHHAADAIACIFSYIKKQKPI